MVHCPAGGPIDAPGTLLLIFVGVIVWLFVTLILALVRQKSRSPLRTMLLIATTLVAVVLGVVCYTVR